MNAKLLIATRNSAKLKEYQDLLADFSFELVSLTDLGITQEVPETGATILANAVLKAEAYGKLSGLPTIADDTAFVVDALNWPGVYARRVWGPNEREATDEEAQAEVLRRTAELPQGQRGCRFASIAALRLADGTTYLGHGETIGEVAKSAQGLHAKGFPYDAIFYLPADRCTVAQSKAKNYLSHRKNAILELTPYLKQLEGLKIAREFYYSGFTVAVVILMEIFLRQALSFGGAATVTLPSAFGNNAGGDITDLFIFPTNPQTFYNDPFVFVGGNFGINLLRYFLYGLLLFVVWWWVNIKNLNDKRYFTGIVLLASGAALLWMLYTLIVFLLD